MTYMDLIKGTISIEDTVDLGGGLKLHYIDMGVIYERGSRRFEIVGEQDCGEAWIGNGDNDAHYEYEKDGAGNVLLMNDKGEVLHTFEDSEEGYEAFARRVL